ncbi:SdpI family protein [Sphaerochaeta sp.]|uniref:SdpI family protein n=1 Tax=Sphaerochaeta sp. TaxID=1972642 RepID=UPI002FC8A19A
MKKQNSLIDRTLVVTTLVCLLPLVFSLVVYRRLPDRVPIHFNVAGEPDNYAPKAFAAFGIPLLLALLNVVLQIVLKTDPKRDPKERIYLISRWILAPLSLLLTPLSLLIALGSPLRVEKVVPLAVAFLFLLIGNYLPKCKQNYTIGIKLPWTLADEENWKKTHRFAGWLWTIGSLLLIILLLLGFPSGISFFSILVILAFAPMIYSFALSRKNGPIDTP